MKFASQPLLSIVIANYNYGRFLEEAIQSVVTQDMEDKVELIVCDADSTDNSVEIIKKYAKGLPSNTSYDDWAKRNSSLTTNDQHLTTKITWWCSEPDGGQSAAFNKGFSHAKGRFLTWLNADDVLMPGTLKAFEDAVTKYPDCEWFVGGVMWLDKCLRVIKCGRGRPFSRLRASAGVVSVWGPSSFFSRGLYERAGRVDERFFYTMDTDLWRRFYYKCGAIYKPFRDYAWGLRLHEEAKMSGHNFATSSQNDPSHPKWKQLRKENELMSAYYKNSSSMGLFRRILSMRIIEVIKAQVDTFRFRGRKYVEYFC